MKKILVSLLLLLALCLTLASCGAKVKADIPAPQAEPLNDESSQSYIVEDETYDFAYVTGVFQNAAPVEAAAAITSRNGTTGSELVSHETYTVSGDNIRLIYGYQKAAPIVVENGEVIDEGGVTYEADTVYTDRAHLTGSYNFVLAPYGYTLTGAAFSAYRIQHIEDNVIFVGTLLPSQINAVFGTSLADLPTEATLRAEMSATDNRLDTLTLTLSYGADQLVITVNYAYTAEPFTIPG